MLFALLALPSCYQYVPVETATPGSGERFAFEISDQGRVGLGERLGPGVSLIEGRLVGTEGEQYLISVFRVATINGESSAWSGETMRLDRNYVSRVRERELNRTRTVAAATAASVVVVAVVLTTGLAGFFTGTDDDRNPPDPPVDFRPLTTVVPIPN